jgi:hypothetical protein
MTHMFLLEVANPYGPFGNAVDVATAAVAAAGALVATVWGEKRWHPTEAVIERLLVLVVAIGLLLLGFAPTWGRVLVAVVGVVVSVMVGLRYSGLLGIYRYRMETTADAAGKTRTWYVVKGDRFTPDAQARVKEGEPIELVVSKAGYKPDLVWDSESRARNAHQLEKLYMPMVIAWTLGLASAVMAVSA